MKSLTPRRMRAREYIDSLAAAGRYHFNSRDAQAAFGATPAAVKLALSRLAHQKLIASPARGFYVIVPPEYRALGCLPPEQFIPALMQRLDQPYYAGLLTAAQFHGAAHQRPQAFQVVVGVSRRLLVCRAVRVVFVVRKRVADVPVVRLNTPRGDVRVSSPEATAIDLVGYADRVGGLGQVATVLSELAERLDPDVLVTAARTAPITWAQRLGYLLDDLGFDTRTAPLKSYVAAAAKLPTVLLPKASAKRARRNDAWKLDVNTKVHVEL